MVMPFKGAAPDTRTRTTGTLPSLSALSALATPAECVLMTCSWPFPGPCGLPRLTCYSLAGSTVSNASATPTLAASLT